MKFGEKLRKQRTKLNFTQQEVADLLGVALRTYTNYENAEKQPRKREVYIKLSEVLQVNINYLLTDDEEFTIKAHEKYGVRGAKQAQGMIKQIGAMYAGGELSDDDMDAVMQSMQKLYWDAKKENKKYTPKKYRENN